MGVAVSCNTGTRIGQSKGDEIMKKYEEKELLELLKTTPRTFEEICAFLRGEEIEEDKQS